MNNSNLEDVAARVAKRLAAIRNRHRLQALINRCVDTMTEARCRAFLESIREEEPVGLQPYYSYRANMRRSSAQSQKMAEIEREGW